MASALFYARYHGAKKAQKYLKQHCCPEPVSYVNSNSAWLWQHREIRQYLNMQQAKEWIDPPDGEPGACEFCPGSLFDEEAGGYDCHICGGECCSRMCLFAHFDFEHQIKM